MAKPVTAKEVTEGTTVWHERILCHITEVTHAVGGLIYITWRESVLTDSPFYCEGFKPGAYFGEQTGE